MFFRRTDASGDESALHACKQVEETEKSHRVKVFLSMKLSSDGAVLHEKRQEEDTQSRELRDHAASQDSMHRPRDGREASSAKRRETNSVHSVPCIFLPHARRSGEDLHQNRRDAGESASAEKTR